jgi:formylglycine-generating enzyme required for sulfatase activity
VKRFADQLKDTSGVVLGIGPELVALPPGTYRRGSSYSEFEREPHEGPPALVTISRPFAVGIAPITVAQYKLYIAHRELLPWRPGNEHDGRRSVNREAPTELRRFPGLRFQQPDHFPVHYINWFDARGYAEWLSERTGQRYRLPTESEWEYMARAGSVAAFPWGQEFRPDAANWGCCYDDINVTPRRHQAGSLVYPGAKLGTKWPRLSPTMHFPPNAWGIYDVLCNVTEWCEDVWHDDYVDGPTDGTAWMTRPQPPSQYPHNDTSRMRVLRGYDTLSARRGDGRGYRMDCRGFRVVRELSE